MIYTPLTKKALKLCFEAHKNQVDKTNMPYVFHPFHLAEQMTDEYSTVCALLHDVVEDTDYTFEDLESMGFPNEVIEALKLLTHLEDVPYMDYVQALKDNPDWWTCDVNYSRYNHDSAVATINSLPDCSATGTNTIKFKGTMGAKTDGGAINTLTEEEIAVAAAKGWTVSLV
jgi:hypothetical protein